MMAACMEQKRLELANKTIMVVPKPLIGQTASEYLSLQVRMRYSTLVQRR